MDAVTGFVAIVSLLLALSAGGSTTDPQTSVSRKAGKEQVEYLVAPSKLATNHNETLVSDAAR